MAVMMIEPNVFDRPTVVAGYDAITVPVPVYVPGAAASEPTATGRRKWAMALFVAVGLLLASGAAAYAGWG
jgi:hypothetical protein